MITIGVIAHQHLNETLKCLRAIRDYSKEYQLIFVNNGGKTNLIAAENFAKNVLSGIIIQFDNLISVSKARNSVIKEATQDFITFIDNDIIVCDGWRDAMLAPFDDPLVGIVGYEAIQITTDFDKQYLAKEDQKFDYIDSPYVVRKSMIEQIGGYDEKLGMSTGDNTDLMIRARKYGWKIVLIQNPGIEHKRGMTRASLSQEWMRLEIEKSKQRLRELWGANWKIGDFWSTR